MRSAAALLLAVLLLAAGPVHAADGGTRGRGWLTGVGLGFVALTFGGVGLGVGGLLQMSDANTLLTAYVGNGRTPLADEAEVVNDLRARAGAGQSLATAGFVIGGAGLVGAVVCLVLDGVWAGRPVDVAFAPAPGGGAFVFAARF
jgi:hypothetical protein